MFCTLKLIISVKKIKVKYTGYHLSMWKYQGVCYFCSAATRFLHKETKTFIHE